MCVVKLCWMASHSRFPSPLSAIIDNYVWGRVQRRILPPDVSSADRKAMKLLRLDGSRKPPKICACRSGLVTS